MKNTIILTLFRKYILGFFIFSVHSLIASKSDIARLNIDPALKPTHSTKDGHIPRVTIWVHGSSMSVGKLFNKCPMGLSPIAQLPEKSHIRKISTVMCKKDPQRFQYKHFYTFGWSGKLSFEEREAQAKALYNAIKDKVNEMKKSYGFPPIVTVMTHSHGGNLVLNLSKVKDTADEVVINELVLLACPVQGVTAPLIKDSMFKKIYHFYSQIDLLQVVDPQGSYKQTRSIQKDNEGKIPFFSQRTFPEQENLVQGYVRYRRRPLTHLDFILPHVAESLPNMLQAMDNSYFEKEGTKKGIFAVRIAC